MCKLNNPYLNNQQAKKNSQKGKLENFFVANKNTT